MGLVSQIVKGLVLSSSPIRGSRTLHKQFLHQDKWLTMSQIQHKIPHMMQEINGMDTIDY